jgi:site-specific DNA-adenine methylase
MWSYYGSKSKVVKLYPPPKYDRIIEPFAGSARYSLLYYKNEVTLIDKYKVIVDLWKWLQKCSKKDIIGLPHFVKPGASIESLNLDCKEAEYLMGFLVGYGMERPRRTASVRKMVDRPNYLNHSLKVIAENLDKIRHWNIIHDDYRNLDNTQATWFVDPPYQVGGHSYPCSNRHINYEELAAWCKSRNGQTIVCEKVDADWLDFKLLAMAKGSSGMQIEGIWSNLPTLYERKQLQLFGSH